MNACARLHVSSVSESQEEFSLIELHSFELCERVVDFSIIKAKANTLCLCMCVCVIKLPQSLVNGNEGRVRARAVSQVRSLVVGECLKRAPDVLNVPRAPPPPPPKPFGYGRPQSRLVCPPAPPPAPQLANELANTFT